MATIKDVARIAGVSVSTVSHVVNGTRYVSPEKVKKVEKSERPSVLAKLNQFKELVKNAVVDRTKRKELER